MIQAVSTSTRAVCKCGAPAVWEMAPCDSFGEYCDECVPRGCSCNAKSYPYKAGGAQHRDDRGRLLPCVEFDYWPEGFPAGDRAEAEAYRARFMPAPAEGQAADD
jgi:hypothetical protein